MGWRLVWLTVGAGAATFLWAKWRALGGGGCLPTWHWTSRNIMCARGSDVCAGGVRTSLLAPCAARCRALPIERRSERFRSTIRGRWVTPIPGFTRFCSFAEIWFAEIWFSRAELSKKPIGKLRSVASKGPDRARGMPSGHTPYTARTVAAASGSTGGEWYNVDNGSIVPLARAPTHSPLSRDQQPPRSAPGTHRAPHVTRQLTECELSAPWSRSAPNSSAASLP